MGRVAHPLSCFFGGTTVDLGLGVKTALVTVVLAMLAMPLVSFADEAADLYKSKCAMCHGPDGSGKSVMGEKLKVADLRSPDVQKKSDAELTCIVAKGKGKMPAYEAKLTKEQVAKVVTFIRELGKKR
jgi:mono/diheme cytochrome c family protein